LNKRNGFLFVVSGASGTGKTTLCRALEKDLGLFFSVSVTTREKRVGEEEGKDYLFISREKFKKMIQEGEFLEWAEVHDNYYGTPKAPIEKHLMTGSSVILDLDTQGALQLRKELRETKLIFVQPPTLEALKERLVNRGTDSSETIEKRINKAESEIAESGQYDHVLVNEDLNKTKEELETIVRSYLNPT